MWFCGTRYFIGITVCVIEYICIVVQSMVVVNQVLTCVRISCVGARVGKATGLYRHWGEDGCS